MVKGTTSNFTVVLGSSSTFVIFNFNAAYTVLLAYLKASLFFTMAGSGTRTDAAYAINADGTITSFDYFLLNIRTLLLRPGISVMPVQHAQVKTSGGIL